jgi:hypothetical protein
MNPNLTTDQLSTFLLVNGLIGVSGLVSLVFVGIQTFRRKPPAEAQFADAQVNLADHVTIHRRVSDLRDECDRKFVSKEFLASLETVRSDDRKAIFKQLHELTIAVSDLAARLDERRNK